MTEIETMVRVRVRVVDDARRVDRARSVHV
jgi:hypothetical protein